MARATSRTSIAAMLALAVSASLLASAAPAIAHERAACAAADRAWAAAQASGDRARMTRVAGQLPRRCEVWRRARLALLAHGGAVPGIAGEPQSIGGHPRTPGSGGHGQPQNAPPTPPVTGSADPMSGVPASHAGDAPPQ